MADFMYLFRGGDSAWANRSPEEIQKHMQRWGAWMGELTKSGHFKAGEPLAREGRQLVGKDRRLVDGPFAEAKDIVGGYLIVQAKDINEATELARGCPIFDHDGIVEIRPVQQMKT
jgi:hypothetical protein